MEPAWCRAGRPEDSLPEAASGRRTEPAFHRSIQVPSLLVSIAILVLLGAAGVGAVVVIRRWWLKSGDDRGDWAKTLSEYKNLRDEGVLSEEEYRNIRTLVEPRLRGGAPAIGGRHRPTVDVVGPEHGRK